VAEVALELGRVVVLSGQQDIISNASVVFIDGL
jgi:NAD(P)H-hydrate repair Nnr-like enzyme with NAD(P)H-hydrate dehydratase domain